MTSRTLLLIISLSFPLSLALTDWRSTDSTDHHDRVQRQLSVSSDSKLLDDDIREEMKYHSRVVMRPKKPPRPKSEVFLNKQDPHPRRKRFSAFGVSTKQKRRKRWKHICFIVLRNLPQSILINFNNTCSSTLYPPLSLAHKPQLTVLYSLADLINPCGQQALYQCVCERERERESALRAALVKCQKVLHTFVHSFYTLLCLQFPNGFSCNAIRFALLP